MVARSTSPIFVGGVPCSGVALLGAMLDAHPGIVCVSSPLQSLAALWTCADRSGPLLETAYALRCQDVRNAFSNLILSFLEAAGRARGKSRVAEATASNLLVFPQLGALFPGSPLIHVIRDARDVVASRLERCGPAGEEFEHNGSVCEGSTPARSTCRARAFARQWVDAMAVCPMMLADPALSCNYVPLRYEDLVRAPQATLASLFASIGERFDSAAIPFRSAVAGDITPRHDSVGRWRQDLDQDLLGAVMDEAHRTLLELGYLPHEEPV